MAVERIMIIGGPGAGKTSLARDLGQITGLPVVHLDRLFLRPGWTNIPQAEMDQQATDAAMKPRWIIDGNYAGTWSVRVHRAQLVVFLDISRNLRLWRLVKRWLRFRGRSRPELGAGLPERLDREFWSFARAYDTEGRLDALRLVKRCHDKGRPRCVILRNPKAVRWFLQEMRRKGGIAHVKKA